MIEKRYIVEKALAEIGLAGSVFDLSPEEQTDVLTHLDDYMGMLKAQGIEIGYRFKGYPLEDEVTPEASQLSDESGLDHRHIKAVSTGLALSICPMFGKTPPPQLNITKQQAHNALLTMIAVVPKTDYPHGYPLGRRRMGWR